MPIYTRRAIKRSRPPSDVYALSASDYARIPWHSAAGAWGAQVPLQIAERPVTSRSVTVHNLADLSTEANIPGTEVTLGTSVLETDIVFIDASNIDVVIPPGVVGGTFYLETGRHHLRIRGNVEGTRSGGRFSRVYCELNNTDVLVDGLDLNGARCPGIGSEGIGAPLRNNNCLRFGIYRTSVIATSYLALGSSAHMLFKDSNLFHGAWTRAQVTAESGGGIPNGEGWGVRNANGPMTFLDCDVRGTRYVNIRAHTQPGQTEELLYIGRSRFVPYAEGRVLWAWVAAGAGNGPGPGEGFIFEDNEIYAYTVCTTGELKIENSDGVPCSYSRVRRNTFRIAGSTGYDQAYLDGQAALTGDHEWNDSNTFATWVSGVGDVPWDKNSSGAPTLIPLQVSGGYPVSYGEGLCTAFPF